MSPPEDATVYAARQDSVSSSVSDEDKVKICKADAHKASEMRSRNKYAAYESSVHEEMMTWSLLYRVIRG